MTKWSKDCDVALHRLVSYINSSLDIRMQGFIGDKIGDCKLWLFCDADWAGEYDFKSTSGCALYLVGPNTYYLLNAFNKKQTSITMSVKSSQPIMAFELKDFQVSRLWQVFWKEVAVSADRKVRPKNKPAHKDETLIARVDPALDEIRYGGTQHDEKSVADINGLNLHLSEKFQVQFLEDNQAAITIITKGDSEKMRHTDRTQQVANIFTKPFADKTKWNKALALINHVDCSQSTLAGDEDTTKGQATKGSDSHLLHKPHVHGSPAACDSNQQQHQRHDRPLAAAANALPETRPSDCNRIVVEFCCDPDSKLGQSRHASRGCFVVRVTEEQDATKMTNIRKLVRHIHQLCDEGR